MATGRLHLKVLFLTFHSGSEDVVAVRKMVDAKLKDGVIKKLNDIALRLTFGTDCAPIMPKVFSASVSPRLVPFGEKWLGCTYHRGKSDMKLSMAAPSVAARSVGKNIAILQNIVALL